MSGATRVHRQSERAPQRALLVWFSTGHLAIDWASVAMWLLAPAVAATMGLTPAEVGLLITLHSMGAALAYLPAGLVADRVGNRGALLAATFWWVTIGYFAASYAPGFWSFALLLAVAGMGDAAWHPIATGVLTQASPERRAHVLGLHAIGGTLAEVLAPLAAGFLLAWFDWRQVLQISVLPPLLAGLAFLVVRHRVPRSSAEAISGTDLGELVRVWCSPRGGMIVAAIAFYNMAFMAILSMTPLYLQGAHGFTSVTTGIVFSAMLLLGALAQPYLGLASDLIGRRRVVLAGNAIAGIAAMVVFASESAAVVIAGLVLASSVLTGIRSAALAAAVDFAGRREATTLGLAFALMDGVGALGGALAGLAAWYDLAYAFVVAATLSALSGVCGLFLPARSA